jgi:cytidine deaminase
MLFGVKSFLEGSKLFDVIEFGRAVHAEMDAISQAARLGTSLQGARLFCTTFPCHICARHIVAAGIADVTFIEPYDKSRTSELYPDSISIEPHEPSQQRANFRAFVGVAPRRYFDMFQMTSERKNADGGLKKQNAEELRPKFKRFVFAYVWAEMLFEQEYINLLNQEVSQNDGI